MAKTATAFTYIAACIHRVHKSLYTGLKYSINFFGAEACEAVAQLQ